VGQQNVTRKPISQQNATKHANEVGFVRDDSNNIHTEIADILQTYHATLYVTTGHI